MPSKVRILKRSAATCFDNNFAVPAFLGDNNTPYKGEYANNPFAFKQNSADDDVILITQLVNESHFPAVQNDEANV